MTQHVTEYDSGWLLPRFHERDSAPGQPGHDSTQPEEQPQQLIAFSAPALQEQKSAGEALLAGVDVGSKDVLVVDDEPYLCDLISNVLEAEGHIARSAANGLEALQQISERLPNLILLDLMMPVMDGWEFLQKMRANPNWESIPVVLITAIYDVRRVQQQTGARAVITKPFDIDQVSEVVRKYAT